MALLLLHLSKTEEVCARPFFEHIYLSLTLLNIDLAHPTTYVVFYTVTIHAYSAENEGRKERLSPLSRTIHTRRACARARRCIRLTFWRLAKPRVSSEKQDSFRLVTKPKPISSATYQRFRQ